MFKEWYDTIDMSYAQLILTANDIQLSHVAAINQFFQDHGAPVYVKPLTLSCQQTTLDLITTPKQVVDADYKQVLTELALSRETAVALITEAKQALSVAGGGAMTTLQTNHQVQFPRINQVDPAHFRDFNQPFNQLHVNYGQDNIYLNEIMQMIAGCIRFCFKLDVGLVTLDIVCKERQAWYLIFRSDQPHGGYFSPHHKQLATVIGPKKWATFYLD